MIKHTPAPWAVCVDACGDTFVASMSDSAETICEFGCANNDSDQAQIEADARLTAASPELLGALEWIDENPFGHRSLMVDIARAALAKARGQ